MGPLTMAVGVYVSFFVAVKKGELGGLQVTNPLERLGQYVSGGCSLISEETSSEDADNVR